VQELISLRRVCDDDETFLFGLFCMTQSKVLEPLQLPVGQMEQLLRMQFAGQRMQYHDQYSTADFDVVLRGGVPIGSLYALRGPQEYVLIDIALLPECRGSGIGTQLVNALISEANAAKKKLEAHVLKSNRAWRLWQRLGFELVDDDGVYLHIRVPADFT